MSTSPYPFILSYPWSRLPTPDPAPPTPLSSGPSGQTLSSSQIPLRDISEEQLSVSERKLSIRWGWGRLGRGRVGRGGGGRGQLSCASCCCCLICGDHTSCCVWCSLRGGSEQKGFSAELDLFKTGCAKCFPPLQVAQGIACATEEERAWSLLVTTGQGAAAM